MRGTPGAICTISQGLNFNHTRLNRTIDVEIEPTVLLHSQSAYGATGITSHSHRMIGSGHIGQENS